MHVQKVYIGMIQAKLQFFLLFVNLIASSCKIYANSFFYWKQATSIIGYFDSQEKVKKYIKNKFIRTIIIL